MPEGLPSVAMALRQASAVLEPGSDSARADAEFLLAQVLGLSRSRLRLNASAILSDAQHAAYAGYVERRRQGEPVAYITGTRGFWTLDVQVTPAALIPRPETELLIEWTLRLVELRVPERRRAALQLADLGTGSGAIALALAAELPASRVLATDLSAEALDLARRNAEAAQLSNLRFGLGSWFAPLRADAAGPRFDFLISNPPYIAEGDAHLAALRHEPRMALTSGVDGLDALREIVACARPHLLPGGWLLVEHGYDQGAAVRALFEAAGFADVKTRRDLGDQERATGGQAPP